MAACQYCGTNVYPGTAVCPNCGRSPFPAAPQSPQAPVQSAAIPLNAAMAKGFFASLFDLSFSSFITTKLVKVLFVIFIVIAGLEALAMLVYGFSLGGVTGGLVALIFAPVIFLFIVVIGRVYLEICIVLFRSADYLAEIAAQGRR